MKTYWFYLESYTFILEGRQGMLTYNTLNGAVVRDGGRKEIRTLLEQLQLPVNGYCIRITEEQLENKEIQSFITEIRNTFSGDWIDCELSQRKPFIFKPRLNLLDDPEKTILEKGYTLREDLLQYLHEVTIQLDTPCRSTCIHCAEYHKQSLFCTHESVPEVLDTKEYIPLLDRLSTLGIHHINITGGNLAESGRFRDLLQIAGSYTFQVHLYTYYENVDPGLIALLKNNDKFVLTLLCEGIPEEEQIQTALSYTQDAVCNWHFLISSGEEYEQINRIREEFGLPGEIIPFYDGQNEDFFRQYIYMDVDDILAEPISKQQIFRRQVMNENLFGKLTIAADGTVYSNRNKPALGNIRTNTLNELVYKEIAEKNCWLWKREDTSCHDCVYKLLCPPPGNYELVLEKSNLCHITRS